MKFIYLIFLISTCFTLPLAAQTTQQGVNKDIFSITEKVHDFGKIQIARPVSHRFIIRNTGSEPATIESVIASCGCTTPRWVKKPVAPGDTTSIEVGYNAAEEGPFEKQISVFYNKGSVLTLTVKGNVYMLCGTPAPLNPVIRDLKQETF